jgi:hypothetical protein
MFSADLVHGNDQAQFELGRASQKAALAWRFRHMESWEARIAGALVRAVSAAVKDALGNVRSVLNSRARLAIGSARKPFSH